jgi:hypothetical protein
MLTLPVVLLTANLFETEKTPPTEKFPSVPPDAMLTPPLTRKLRPIVASAPVVMLPSPKTYQIGVPA